MWLDLTKPIPLAESCRWQLSDADVACRVGGWTWADHTNYSYMDWITPPNPSDNCARLQPGGWKSVFCKAAKYRAICEKGKEKGNHNNPKS